MSSRWLGVVACAVAAIAGGLRACGKSEFWPGPAGPPPSRPSPTAEAPVPSADTAGPAALERPRGGHPRILLTADRLAAVQGLRVAGAPSWRSLQAHCDEDVRENIASGYQAWDWANAILDLALCHAVTRRPQYARAAIRYFRALLDDYTAVGDGAGGEDVARHDDGYAIRTHGCFGALAYDWLHDEPGMTPELRRHAVDRFVTWTKWFSADGYQRDEPIANYYMGYFGTVAFAGIAAEGDDPRAVDLLRRARRMYDADIVPRYGAKLAGGDFPEGWQYADMIGAILAIYADAESRDGAAEARGRSAFDELPWLEQTVAYRVHALWPDGRHTFDTGDWSQKPAVAPPHTLLALATVLPPSRAAERQARALARLALDSGEEWHWLAALGDDPSGMADDPRRGTRSYLARGTGTVTARTDWSPQAVWVALTSAPSLSDHQHLDAGHFEMVRGGDALIVDSGGYGSFSSLSHNVIAVDDSKENDNYAPNQGVWSDAAAIARYEDEPRWTYAVADYASAYNPAGYPADHPQRSVTRAEREIVFSRAPVAGIPHSARLVVYDRVTLTRPVYATTFLLHGAGQAPETAGESVRFVAGRSAAVATTLLPAGVEPVLVHEPTVLGDGAFYANDPPEGTRSVRIEVRSPRQGTERRFLHAIVVGPSDAKPPAPVRIEGEGVDGAAIADEAYVFGHDRDRNEPAALSYRAPEGALHHLVASLAPGVPYDVGVARDGDACRVSIVPGRARVASSAGILALELGPACVLR